MHKRRYLILILMLGMVMTGVVGAVLSADAENEDTTEATIQSDIVTPIVSRKANTGYDFVFVIDNSRSIWKQQAERDQALRTVANLSVGSDVRIGSVYFADHVYKTFSLTSVESQEDYKKVINDGLTLTKQDNSNQDTNIGAGLEAGLQLFEDQDSGRKKIMILVSDGINENLAQNPSYKERANTNTAVQAEKLNKQGIELYCVFIEKDRANEDYLQELVNSAAGDSNAADTRFVSVSDSQMDKLADTFSQVFYSMKGNMKYKQIRVDSSGRYTFHIPDLNVEKLQIYLNNSDSIGANLTRVDGEEFEKNAWTDGNSIFFTVDNPTSGDWTIEVEGENAKNSTGTIAYYTDLYAAGNWDSEIYKGCTTRLSVNFTNKDGESVELDSAAVVTANLTIQNEKGKIVQKLKNLPLTIESDRAYTDDFQLEKLGTINCTVRVQYDEVIDLSYKVIDGLALEALAPGTTGESLDLHSIRVETENGIKEQFTLDLNEYIFDKDSDVKDFTLESVDVINQDNPPVEVTLKKGKLVCLVDKAEDVEFIVTLADDTGLTTQMTVEGLVINKNTERSKKTMLKWIVILVLVLIVIYIVIGHFRRREYQANLDILKGMKDKLLTDKKKLDSFMMQRGYQTTSSQESTKETDKKTVNLKKVKKHSETSIVEITKEDWEYQQAYQAVKGFVDSEEVAEEVLQVWGVDEILNHPMSKTIAQTAKTFYNEYNRQIASLEDAIEDYMEYRKMTRGMLKEELKKLKREVRKHRKRMEKNPDSVMQLENISREFTEVTEELKLVYQQFQQASKQKFSCNLSMRVMGEPCLKAKNNEWYWKMDDVTVTSKNRKVADAEFLNKKTQIVFFPYNGVNSITELPETGVVIAAPYAFEFKEISEAEMSNSTQTVLLKEKTYLVDTGSVAGSITIQIL